MQNHVAFLNEWGDNSLDFEKKSENGIITSTHFIVTALTAVREDAIEIRRIISAIQKRHFQGSALNSSVVDNNHELRKLILEDLCEAPFQIFALVVDKRQLIGEGLRYKGSFYKFLYGLADKELFRIFPDLQMIAGEIGSDSFMEGFIKYVHQNHISNLFNESSFGFINAQNEAIVQAADLVAGTLARCYDETVITDQRQQFLDLMQPKLMTIKFWPDVFNPYQVRYDSQDQQYDKGMAELSINLANDFLQGRAKSTVPHVIDQVTTLSYLVFHFRHINAIRYISSFEIMEHIKVRRGKAVSLHYFQTKVIAPLRDAGVLIASSSKGYKLPANESDLYDFINHSNAIIEPMLSRVKKFRDQIRLATNGKLDVFNKDEYSLIRKVVE